MKGALDSLEKLAVQLNIPVFHSLLKFAFVQQKKNIIPYLFAKNRALLPVEEKEGRIVVATSNPRNLQALQELSLFLNKETELIFTPKVSLEAAIERCYHQKKEIESRKNEELLPKDKDSDVEGYDLLEQVSDHPVVQLANQLLMEAITQGASDVHFDPEEALLKVRYRIDGVLQTRTKLTKEMKPQLIARIKVMAKLDIAEQRLPQDGRIKLKMGGRDIDFRVSTLPTHLGERVVLRILDKGNLLLGLGEIGMQEETLRRYRKLIQKPEGIILVTGPTGSGKTTTLYSTIAHLNSEEINIITIEDPVEYKLSGIAQIGVNPKIGLSFARGLRHILRQDPDVIMVGEVRDHETAEIAIQASLTGHLVLSTLHTNDAPSAITRLADMGIEPYLLSSSIIGVVAQRLVRRICPACKEGYQPLEQELKDLGMEEFHGMLYRGKGCEDCYHTGYKGRRAIYELMVVNNTIRTKIMEGLDLSKIREAADLTHLRKDGVRLAIEGVTTSSEVLRVTQSSSFEES